MVGQAVILGQAQWEARETETQIAVPLRIGERTIGALDLLLAGRNAMYEADLMIWQLLSDQLAGAIENSRLFNESQETLRQLQAVYGQYTKNSWQAAVTVQGRPQGYLYRRLGVEPLMNQPVEVQSLLAEGKSATLETGAQGSLLGVPIKLREQVLGVLKVRFEEETVPEEAAGLIEDIAARLALSLENARLLEETRNQAARERMVTDITARVRAETEVEALLERALGELSLVLNARRAAVQLEVRE
jgi:GAF domain-containing protein